MYLYCVNNLICHTNLPFINPASKMMERPAYHTAKLWGYVTLRINKESRSARFFAYGGTVKLPLLTLFVHSAK